MRKSLDKEKGMSQDIVLRMGKLLVHVCVIIGRQELEVAT